MDITGAKELGLERSFGKHVSYWQPVRLMMMDLWSWSHLLHRQLDIATPWVRPLL